MKGEPTTFAGLCRAEPDELFISLNFRHKKTRFWRVVSFYVFQWLREPDLNRGPLMANGELRPTSYPFH